MIVQIYRGDTFICNFFPPDYVTLRKIEEKYPDYAGYWHRVMDGNGEEVEGKTLAVNSDK